MYLQFEEEKVKDFVTALHCASFNIDRSRRLGIVEHLLVQEILSTQSKQSKVKRRRVL